MKEKKEHISLNKIEQDIFNQVIDWFEDNPEKTQKEIENKISAKVRQMAYLKQDWQVHYAIERIKKEVFHEALSSRQLLPTTRTKRFSNSILDYIGLYLLSLAFGYVFAYALGYLLRIFAQEKSVDFILENEWLFSNIFGWFLGVVIAVLYYAIFESVWSKTPAKFITKTKVIMEDGKKPGYGTIFTRTLIRFVPFDAFSFLSSKRPVGWHDKWSKTIVIDDNTKKQIGWYNESTDHFLCVSCFAKIKNINQRDYKLIGEDSLEDDVYTCDKCKRVFECDKD